MFGFTSSNRVEANQCVQTGRFTRNRLWLSCQPESCGGDTGSSGERLCLGLHFRLRRAVFFVDGLRSVPEDRVQFHFTDHTLDTTRRELRRGGASIAIEPQVFDLLTYLVENRERVVSKDDLFAAVWGGRIVADSTLGSRINAVRRAIGDSGEEQKLIRTISRKGVRFVGQVRCQPEGDQSADSTARSPDGSKARAHAAAQSSERPSIAVLPFANMSGDLEQDYFSDGISEDLITALSKLRWFSVIARNSSFTYKGRSVHLKEISEDLGVAYVVEGSVRKDRGRVRITVQLNDVATGSHLWAERYDRDLADVFAVQDEITEAIVAAIEPQLYSAENFRAQRKAPENLDAWDLVMRALSHFWRVTRQDNIAAQALLEKAIAIDPHYSQAFGVLAVSHVFGTHMVWEDAATAVPAAERAGLAAIAVDGEDPWAHFGLACAYANLRRHHDSLAEFELTLRLNPNFAFAQSLYGLVLSYCGRWEESNEAVGRALRLNPRDPLSAVYNGVAAYTEYVRRNYSQAIKLARDAIRQRFDFVGAHRVLTAAAGMTGDIDLARSAVEDLRRVHPTISIAWCAGNLLMLGDAERAHFLEGLRRAGLE
jgi:TolB-like protein